MIVLDCESTLYQVCGSPCGLVAAAASTDAVVSQNILGDRQSGIVNAADYWATEIYVDDIGNECPVQQNRPC
jgi:hypothetical protein